MASILYGSELWNGLSVTDVEQSQHYIAKAIPGFHNYTRSDMCESMLGLPPLVGQTVLRKLMFLHKILSLSAGTTCKDIFVRRYLHFISPHINYVRMKGFVPDICRILTTYNLCHIINDSLPSKAQWKREISNAIGEREERLWLTRIDHDPDFSLFKHIQNAISPSVIWQYPATRSQLSLAYFVAKVVTEKSNHRDICGCLHTTRTIHILSGLSQPGTDSLIT